MSHLVQLYRVITSRNAVITYLFIRNSGHLSDSLHISRRLVIVNRETIVHLAARVQSGESAFGSRVIINRIVATEDGDGAEP